MSLERPNSSAKAVLETFPSSHKLSVRAVKDSPNSTCKQKVSTLSWTIRTSTHLEQFRDVFKRRVIHYCIPKREMEVMIERGKHVCSQRQPRATTPNISASDNSLSSTLIQSGARKDYRKELFPGRSTATTNYEKSLLTDVLPSWFFLSTLATANSKSSCVTCCLRSRSAYIPEIEV